MLAPVPAALAQQQHGAQGQENATWSMPEACQESATGSASTPTAGQGQAMGQPEMAMPGGGSGMQQDGMAMQGEMSPAMQGYMAAMDGMQQGMPDQPSGDADVDFARMMIPHHQSAIEMAEIVLEHGEDETISNLAKEVIASQSGEIEELCGFLQEHQG